jgi:hypothetical protein
MRAKTFQDRLLEHKVCYEKNDPKFLYMDAEAVDGASMMFLFGSDRNQTCDNHTCCVTGVRLIRIRFDLLASNETEKALSLKFMSAFVKHFQSLEKQPNKYNFFEFSYYTSHTILEEIEKYSLVDVNFVLVAGAFFWLIYFLFLAFDFKMIKNMARKICSTDNGGKKSGRSGSHFFGSKSFWVRTPGYLVFVTIAQFVLTCFSTLGLMSLFRVQINTTLYSIVFVLIRKNYSKLSCVKI